MAVSSTCTAVTASFSLNQRCSLLSLRGAPVMRAGGSCSPYDPPAAVGAVEVKEEVSVRIAAASSAHTASKALPRSP